ncbi:MAG: Alanine--tRNA ligase [Microgenomates bacterium OLB22]|nr:MAG: Alanine--tRNA ligase [Microgenomates bacterium OLB22]
MLGNWSLGIHFKAEQIPAMWELYTEVFGLAPERLHVSVFEGDASVPMDQESYDVWKTLGLSDDHIHWYGVEKNWWSRSGVPSQMPVGEIGGPDTELFYEFTSIDHDPSYGIKCHPNCDCGRFMEIGNSVFIQYIKSEAGGLDELSQKSIDFGGGLERIMAAQLNNPDIFQTELFVDAATSITSLLPSINSVDTRIILDHLRASLFLIKDGISPANKEHGYLLRRLLRRAALSVRKYRLDSFDASPIIMSFTKLYKSVYEDIDVVLATDIIQAELHKFNKLLDSTKTLLDGREVTAHLLFNLYQSHGIPLEISLEQARHNGLSIPDGIEQDFERLVHIHSESAKSASAGMFKGGLADSSDQVIKYHTATHLIHQALHDLMGESVRQEGSNITQERLRFDFHVDQPAVTDLSERIVQIVNTKIRESIPIYAHTMSKEEAIQKGARASFRERYPDEVTVYAIGGTATDVSEAYSLELCGGPHVTNTGEIGTIIVDKIQKIGATTYRLYAHGDDTATTK